MCRQSKGTIEVDMKPCIQYEYFALLDLIIQRNIQGLSKTQMLPPRLCELSLLSTNILQLEVEISVSSQSQTHLNIDAHVYCAIGVHAFVDNMRQLQAATTVAQQPKSITSRAPRASRYAPPAFYKALLFSTKCRIGQLGRIFQLGFRLSLISFFVPTTSLGIRLTR